MTCAATWKWAAFICRRKTCEQFGIRDDGSRRPAHSKRWQSLMEFEADRAWKFYEEGAEIVGLVERDSRAALWALARTYSSLFGTD